jgi:hypothetical protein
MTAATITKTLKKLEAEPKNYSLGFRRWTVLPNRVAKNVILACVLENKTIIDAQEFFNGLTEEEYINWLKLA